MNTSPTLTNRLRLLYTINAFIQTTFNEARLNINRICLARVQCTRLHSTENAICIFMCATQINRLNILHECITTFNLFE